MTTVPLKACPFGKAKVYKSPNKIILESYGSTVVKADRIISTNMFDIACLESGRDVTNRHISSFLKEYFPAVQLEYLITAEKYGDSIRAILFSLEKVN